MAFDVSNRNLLPSHVLDSFYDRFSEWMRIWVPQLPTNREYLDSSFAEFATLAPHLEDLSKLILENLTIRNYANQVGDLISRCQGSVKAQLGRILQDVLVLACLVPCALVPAPHHYYSVFEYEKPISRYAIRPISPSHCEAILKELRGIVSFDDHGSLSFNLSSTALLSHLEMPAYAESRLPQRMFALSLSHLALPLRRDVLTGINPSQILMTRIKESRLLNYWMLSCASCDEQYFLNTCDTAASLSSIVSYHACIASLIQLGRLVYSEVEKRCQFASDKVPAYDALFGSVTNQTEYVASMVAGFRNSMDELDEAVRQLLDSEAEFVAESNSQSVALSNKQDTEIAFNHSWLLERHQIMRKWHKEMQRLSSVFFPDAPVVLTEKVYPNDWHKSAKRQTVWSLFDQLIPGRPSFLSRSQASRTLEQIDCHYLHTQLALLEPEADNGIWLDFPWSIAEESNPSERLAVMHKLWERIAFQDGLLISSRESLFFGLWTIGHLSYWKAVWLGPAPDDRYFLISDPELQYFKVLSIAQAEKFASNIANQVNPNDGAVVQHYRTRKLCKE